MRTKAQLEDIKSRPGSPNVPHFRKLHKELRPEDRRLGPRPDIGRILKERWKEYASGK